MRLAPRKSIACIDQGIAIAARGLDLPTTQHLARACPLPSSGLDPAMAVMCGFSSPSRVSARTARQLGAAVLTETMERRPEIGFASYDRFFPSQDTMPVGGFGDLIALPSQRRARARVLSCAVRAFPTFDKPKQRFSTVPTDRGFVWR
jgi:hypothetical protein